MPRKIIQTLFVLAIAVSCKNEKKEIVTKSAQQTIVDVLVAAPKTVLQRVEANGTVVANEYVELHPEVSGRLTYLNVPEGKLVKQGTIIAKINDADLQAQLSKSKVVLVLAQKTEERLRKLLAVNGVNEADYDVALSAVNSTKADIDYTQSLIDKTVIKAPFTGVVGLRQVSPGAYVTATNIIATIQQLDKIKIDFTIPEEYSHLIIKGSSVEIETGAADMKQSRKKATIFATEPVVNQDTRNLKVRALLEGGTLNPGAFVKVYVSARSDNKAIMIPTNAIIPDDKNKQVILVKNGKAAFVDVQTGIREDNNIEVVTGVNPGDSVVVTGVLFARPKAILKVRSVKKLEQFSN